MQLLRKLWAIRSAPRGFSESARQLFTASLRNMNVNGANKGQQIEYRIPRFVVFSSKRLPPFPLGNYRQAGRQIHIGGRKAHRDNQVAEECSIQTVCGAESLTESLTLFSNFR